MRHVLARLSVKTPQEMNIFELAMRAATEGFAISRSLAYTEFRLSVLRFQQTGQPVSFRNILTGNHVIETHHGISTLYRNSQDAGTSDMDYEVTPADDYDSSKDENPAKRVRT
jgi:hypothetical protein